MNEVVIGLICLSVLLLLLNGIQFVFWSSQVHKLVDKLMSRNYAEYVLTASPLPSKPTLTETQQDDFDEDLHTLNHLIAGP